MNSNTQFNESITRAALTGLLNLEDLNNLGEVEFSGGDICLDSLFFCGEAASAALAGHLVLADELAKLRGNPSLFAAGDGQHAVNTRLAEASLVSFALQGFADPTKAPQTRLSPEDRTPSAGFFTCRDGRQVYLHSSFPDHVQHTRAILELLNVPADRDAVTAAIAKIPSWQLEENMATAGLCGAITRTALEWDESTPGQLLATVPVVELIKITDGEPQSFSQTGDKPLDGLKVLDLTRVLAGPVCARSLVSLGADVLHVRGEGLHNVEMFVTDTGIGKRSTYLNLKDASDMATLTSLVKQSHVFSQGYRSGVMERLGFGVEQVAELNPNIIYVSINCYGHEGEWCQRPGWEQLAQVVTGMAEHQGNYQVDGTGLTQPVLQPAALNDYTTGYLGALGVLMAKRRQMLEGGGYWVRVSLCRTAMWVRGLGLRDAPVLARFPDQDELLTWYQSFDTAWGGLNSLKPAVSMNGSHLQWPGPPVPLGTHSARFG